MEDSFAMYHETRSVVSDIHLPQKNNLTTPRPITDSKLRRALRTDDDLAKLNVTPQDEKILALMVRRGEWERSYWKKKLRNSVAWDKEKTANDEQKAEKDRQHREQIMSAREEDRQSFHLKKIAREKKRQEKKRQLENELQMAETKTEKLLTEQQKIKAKELKDRIAKEEKLKETQIKNWWEVNSSEYEKKYADHIEHDKKRLHAGVRRDELIHEETERIARENESERLAYTDRYVEYRRKLHERNKALVVRIDRKLHTAEVNYEKEKMKKEKEIHQIALEENTKLEHAIKTQQKQSKKRQKMTKNMWKKDMKKIHQANDNLVSNLQTTVQHIQEERMKREEEQQKNLKQVRRKLNGWKKKLRKDIKARDNKIIKMQEERLSIMEKTRNVAQDSRNLRNRVLDKYGSESFDKKVFRVQRFHSLGTRPSTQDWNTSSISLL